jgi:hypothetical protein
MSRRRDARHAKTTARGLQGAHLAAHGVAALMMGAAVLLLR